MSSAPIWARPEPAARRPRHTREDIAAAAIRIADAEGLDAVSMRRVAAELGAGAMTLYHYVRNKDELLALMDDAVMGELLVPEEELAADWRAALTAVAHQTRGTYARHPWVPNVKQKSQQGGPNFMRHIEQSLAAVAGTGLPAEVQLDVITMLDEYVLGFVAREAVVPDESTVAPLIEYIDDQLGTGRFPHTERLLGGDTRAAFERLLPRMFDEGRFDRGLARLLDGVELEIERHRE